MPISSEALPAVRQAIRSFLRIPDAEPADVIVLASFLLNHVPGREFNLWLVLVGSPDTAKSEIVKLLQGYPTARSLTQRLSPGALLSSRNQNDSAVFEMERLGIRVLLMSDMAALTDGIDRKDRGSIHAQLIDFHDGHMVVQTGLNTVRLEWGPHPPDKTIGWIGAATEEFYRYTETHNRMGDRFLLYYWNKASALHWTDYHETRAILEDLPGKDARRQEAREIVHNFLDNVIDRLDEFPRVAMDPAASTRIAAATRFVGRILGAGRFQGTGARRAIRVREICRMIAFISGRLEVTAEDLDIGMQIMLSQVPPEYLNVLMFAAQPENLAREEGWKTVEMTARLGGSRRAYYNAVAGLVDVAILERAVRTRGSWESWRLRLHPDVATIAAVFDPNRRVFRFKDAPPAIEKPVAPMPTDEEQLIDELPDDVEVPEI